MFDAGVISAREAASVTRCVSYGDSCHFSLDRVNELQCEIGEDWHDRKEERPLQACCEPAPGGEVQMPLQLWKSRFDADEGILYAGRVREKARVVRTERRQYACTGVRYPRAVDGSAMANYYYYCVGDDFGPFCLKSPFPLKPKNFPPQRAAPYMSPKGLIIPANILIDSARKMRRSPSLCTISPDPKFDSKQV
ncbi:hypothetical protein B0G80_9222 [Paraburkholderia sp. BL6669N2]|uniref:hypothetical protein n=1 Tax=Paraburkholderia sp. BL6669N2 TaxID=1938807 RepID=UPI000E389D50|nr:hypothetical protein [Paraburkholderia sp. BL6669N2]REG45597.1 hypothetical protein B0G80_9222 [Paraburkholderia sp. BL6669N2]